ncbi:MAG: hypothetical protein PWQ32_713 [Thermococcaceae archaeon]|nr:hypothetical protein [Thermococcaceae archaeon]
MLVFIVLNKRGERMAKEKTTLPPTGAGLMRFFDEDTRAIKISPRGAIALVLIFVAIEILLNVFGHQIFG